MSEKAVPTFKLSVRCLMWAALSSTALIAVDDINIPVEGGNLVIRSQFIRFNELAKSYVPELAFKIKNETPMPWNTLKLQFDIGGLCNGEPKQWSLPVTMSLGWTAEFPLVKEYKDTVIPLVGKVDGCTAEIITAKLVLAENSKVRIKGESGARIDLEKELQELKARREAEQAAKAQEERKAAEEAVKKEAAETARKRRLAAEQKQRDAEQAARYAREKAEADARAAVEAAKIRTACAEIYKNTANKKVADLTVVEEQKVRACQALGLYPPR